MDWALAKVLGNPTHHKPDFGTYIHIFTYVNNGSYLFTLHLWNQFILLLCSFILCFYCILYHKLVISWNNIIYMLFYYLYVIYVNWWNICSFYIIVYEQLIHINSSKACQPYPYPSQSRPNLDLTQPTRIKLGWASVSGLNLGWVSPPYVGPGLTFIPTHSIQEVFLILPISL